MMLLLRPLFGLCVTLAAVPALVAETTPLWPAGKIPDRQENQVAVPHEKRKALGKAFNPDDYRMPYLEWSEPPAASNRTDACVILISGGGYMNTCDGPAFRPLEKELLKAGVSCVWLWYRTPRPAGMEIYRTAWEDGQRAVRIVRAEAAKRGYSPEKIGVLGCSAGSHLSLMLGTTSQTPAYEPVDELDAIPCHVNWAIPMCPAYALDDGLDGPNRNRGIGAKLNPCFRFDTNTCSMCFFHGEDDPYSPLGSTAIYRRLRQMKIPAELHLDAGRGHGPVSAEAFERAIEYMRQMGFIGRPELEVDLMSRFPKDAVALRPVERNDIWPEGLMPDSSTNQCLPYLDWYVPSNLMTRAIQVIYSGGAYQGNNPDGFEVAPARRYLNARGMAVVTMRYRTPRPKGRGIHESAWQDLQRAIRVIRSKAKAKGLDPSRIGIMGSSAGGHLTLMGAFSSHARSYRRIDALDDLPCNVQWGVGIYPAYVLQPGNDLGSLADEIAFDRDSCPMVFVHGDADVYPSMGSVVCWELLRERGIASDLHTLALRPHCFQRKAMPGTGSYTWLGRIGGFLERQGVLTR